MIYYFIFILYQFLLANYIYGDKSKKRKERKIMKIFYF